MLPVPRGLVWDDTPTHCPSFRNQSRESQQSEPRELAACREMRCATHLFDKLQSVGEDLVRNGEYVGGILRRLGRHGVHGE